MFLFLTSGGGVGAPEVEGGNLKGTCSSLNVTASRFKRHYRKNKLNIASSDIKISAY